MSLISLEQRIANQEMYTGEMLDVNFAIEDTVIFKTDPAGTIKKIYHDEDKDIRGVPRSYYRQLAKEKEKKHGIAPLYSIGFYKQELFSSVEYIEEFSGNKSNIDFEIDQLKRNDVRIVETELVDDQIMIWFAL